MTLAAAAFARIRQLVYERTAIVLDEGKEYLVEARLAPIARAHGYPDVNGLCARIDAQPPALVCEVVEAMTTNETSFFRDQHPFEALRSNVLPELVQRRARTRRLRFWCAGCSTGQEPYSLAMLLALHFPELAGWNIHIHATDVAKAVLTRARAGRYRELEVSRGLRPSDRARFFVQEGAEWEVRRELKRQVHFAELNLIGSWPRMERFDLIFLRNVLIYFDQTTKLVVLEKVRRQLFDGGYLMLGGSETTSPELTTFERMPIARAGLYRAIGTRASLRHD